MVQTERDEDRKLTVVPTPVAEVSEGRQSESLPSTDYPMVLSESDVALMKRIVVRYRGVYDYLADR